MERLAIFASGSGSNAEAIAKYFADHPKIEVALIVSNRKNAGVLQRAERLNIESLIIDRTSFFKSNELLDLLHSRQISFIVLAGFLWLVPTYLISAYPQKIVNIHPALLPKYGGKGMYGQHVHEAVYRAKEKESGISIHYVNEKYDDGAVIFQAKTEIIPGDKPEDISRKVQQLEHQHYPKVIEKLVLNE